MTTNAPPAPLCLAIFHLRNQRPHDAVFNTTLRTLTETTMTTGRNLGYEVEVIASGEHPVSTSLEAAAEANAIVLLGGEDVTPDFYGASTNFPEAGTFDAAADAAHIAVVSHALSRRTPLLGICRGLQVINVALGGTLVQHLPTADEHRGTGRGLKSFRLAPVSVIDDDLSRDVTASPVWHSHHQAIKSLAQGLRVAARSHDNAVVEAVVHESAPITGVQWHPEHPNTAPSQLASLLKRLERQAAFVAVH